MAKFSAANGTASANLVDCVGRKLVVKEKVFLFDAAESTEEKIYKSECKSFGS